MLLHVSRYCHLSLTTIRLVALLYQANAISNDGFYLLDDLSPSITASHCWRYKRL
ncbi:hypothetical protein M917_0148 [Psychrobacter aquaticus CMS 56]|uniref:Uncharacterized protein n=1 Tax=Psychrobacter aquaticus CMS 56 TaxID=1354303 RepID=U4T9Z9_9GAMM|nr:hypothetical protein M917_0148 [Psychrobacter aquaticus CMS 56]